MNEPGTDLQNNPAAADLKERCTELQRLVNLLFGGLIVTSFTLTAYLGLQARRASAELSVTKRHAEEYSKFVDDDAVSAEGIFNRLTQFAQTHPDFQKRILSKYSASTSPPAKETKK